MFWMILGNMDLASWMEVHVPNCFVFFEVGGGCLETKLDGRGATNLTQNPFSIKFVVAVVCWGADVGVPYNIWVARAPSFW